MQRQYDIYGTCLSKEEQPPFCRLRLIRAEDPVSTLATHFADKCNCMKNNILKLELGLVIPS